MDTITLNEIGQESTKIENAFEDHLRWLIRDLTKNNRKIEDDVYEWVERKVWDKYADKLIDVSECEDEDEVEDTVKEWISDNVKLSSEIRNKIAKTVSDKKKIQESNEITEYPEQKKFEQLCDYLEKKLGITFYGDPGSMDDIYDFITDTYGGSADVAVATTGEGEDEIFIKVGYVCTDEGELNIFYEVDYIYMDDNTEPTETNLTDWKEVADKVISRVNKLKE